MFAARQTPAPGGDALARLTWQDFEHLLAEHYRDQGYHVEHVTPAASLAALNAGMDLRLRRGAETVIVQCKHWDAVEVQLADVNELLGNMLNEAATKGVFVTRGGFSAEARAFMRRQPRLQLVDGDVLRVMLKLPPHLDISLPGVAEARAARHAARDAKRDARRPSPRRRGAGSSSMLGPALLAGVLAILLGVFVWHAMSTRHEAEAGLSVSATDVAPPATIAALPRPIASLPPAPPEPTAIAGAPLSGASGIVETRAAPLPLDPPSASRELAERARLRQQSDDARNARKHEDGMKVLEQNTRELGSHD